VVIDLVMTSQGFNFHRLVSELGLDSVLESSNDAKVLYPQRFVRLSPMAPLHLSSRSFCQV